MSEGFDDTSSHSLADVMDKKPEEEILDYVEERIKDLEEDAEDAEYASREHMNTVAAIEELEKLKNTLEELHGL